MKIRHLATAGVAGLMLLSVTATSAHADYDGTATYGADANPDLVVGGGSDTTYKLMQGLDNIYNASPGCANDVANTSANKGKCLAAQELTVPKKQNYDHDVLTEVYPTGSGAGIGSLTLLGGATQTNPAIDYARSSRIPSAAELAVVSGFGYAQDGIAIVSPGGRPGISLTPQQIHDIWTCVITDWATVGGAAGPITPWSMNTSSGTYGVFRDYIRTAAADATFDPNAGACVRKASGPGGPNTVTPFENDLKQITEASEGVDPIQSIWWGSYGELSTYSYKRANIYVGGVAAPVDSMTYVAVNGATPGGGNILANTYPIGRTLYHVTKKADADFTAGVTANGSIDGGTSGKSGAIREYTRFLCKNSNTLFDKPDAYTGNGFRTQIVAVINANGFQQTPGALRAAGSACKIAH